MDPVVALHDALHQLSSADDLGRALDALVGDLRRASTSAVGLEMVTDSVGIEVRVGRFLPGARRSDVLASLLVPLSFVDDDDTSGATRAILYASRAGAFVDLAADLAHTQQVPLSRLELDLHRPSTTESGVSGWERVALVHRAVGVLLDRGLEPDAAHGLLVEGARASTTELSAYAQRVIDEAVRMAED